MFAFISLNFPVNPAFTLFQTSEVYLTRASLVYCKMDIMCSLGKPWSRKLSSYGTSWLELLSKLTNLISMNIESLN